MEQLYEQQTFDRKNSVDTPLQKGEYEKCIFRNCDFSNGDLSEIIFENCEFLDSNLSLIKLTKTALRDVKFKGCKMLGLHFDECHEFGFSVTFEKCSLNHSSFYKRKLKKTRFNEVQLEDVDFTECDLTNSVFENCNFLRAKFERTILEKADFRTSFNYSIDPEINKIKKARFSATEVRGLLDKYDIEIT